MNEPWQQRSKHIAELDEYAQHLGTRLVSIEADRVEILMPYAQHLGLGRVHGGAISGLVDIAATSAFWAHPNLAADARGATVGFTINFLSLAMGVDLTALATVRRRGGTLCTGEVCVTDPSGTEMAIAVVTYKLSAAKSSANKTS